MKKLPIIVEYFRFLKGERKYWIIPVVILLLLMGALVVLFEGSAVAPFIYTIF